MCYKLYNLNITVSKFQATFWSTHSLLVKKNIYISWLEKNIIKKSIVDWMSNLQLKCFIIT